MTSALCNWKLDVIMWNDGAAIMLNIRTRDKFVKMIEIAVVLLRRHVLINGALFARLNRKYLLV